MKRPELVKYLVDCLPPNMTVLLSDASAMTTLSAQMKASIEKRGKVVKFAPQWKVLNHPAVGMVVVSSASNHCGDVESCIRATWGRTRCSRLYCPETQSSPSPLAATNPTPLKYVGPASFSIASCFLSSKTKCTYGESVSDKLKIAIELQQIRSGVDGKTRYNGVVINSTEENIKAEMREAFARITGPEGEEMRKRIQAIRAEYAKSWKEGKSLVAMEEFGRFAVA